MSLLFECIVSQGANFIQVEMAPPTTPEKSGGKPRPGGNDDLIPLLIASNPGGITLNYNRMKDLDPQKRTYYALEHKFRKFKARAKEICDAEATKAAGKATLEAEKSASVSSNQHEDLIPLIIACSPNRLTVNFNRMKDLDPHGRTASSFEHKFRKYKAAAKEILDADGSKATHDEGSSSPKKTPAKKRKTKGEGAQGESDNGEMLSKKRKVVKRGSKNTSAGAEVADPQAERRAVVKEENIDDEADRVMKAQDENPAEEEPGAKTSANDESEDARPDAAVSKKRKPASQPRPPKKGLARIVKKEATFLSESESESESEDEEEPTKAHSVPNKRKAVGAAADKTEAKDKGSKDEPTTEFLAEDAAHSEQGGATAGVGESPGAPSKESAIRLLFE